MKLGLLNAALTGLNAPRLGNPLACMGAVVSKGKVFEASRLRERSGD